MKKFIFLLTLLSSNSYWLSAEVKPSSALQNLQVNRGSWRSLIAPKDDVRISSQREGVIQSYPLPEGTRVKKGDVIVTLDDRAERIQLQNAEASLRRAEAERVKARKEFDRQKTLYDEKITSDKQFAEIVYALEQAESTCTQGLSSVQMAQLELDYRSIKSPCDGVFFKKFKSVGEAVQRNEIVARVIDDSALEVTVYASATYFGQIEVGQELSVQILDGPRTGDKVKSTVTYADTLIDPASGTFRVKLEVQPAEGVYSGLGVMVLF